MIVFLGEYEVTLDAKGRFLLPVGIKKQLPEDASEEFVIARGFEKCLTLYPKKNWDPIMSELIKVNDYKAENREFLRYFTMGAAELELDTAGRLLLPPNLKGYAGLEKDVVLVSVINKIEIWDKSKYQQFFDSFSLEKYSDLAERVMGGRNMTQM
ncbi:MAG: division/cell wall cluster transcriptional repressor MraZ [Chitinophagaceae bacterium]|nr:division/cell wall cluster transcriptional repressor MraZ [Chitinophagaceae bacterium]